MGAGARAGMRLGRIALIGAVLAGGLLAAFGPALWSAAAAPNGTLAAMKRRFELMKGFALFRNRGVRAIIDAEGGAKPARRPAPRVARHNAD